MGLPLPFEGLKVVDLSQGVAGPHCGMLLALNGADVVKVEPPSGDWGRAIGRRYGDFSAYNVAYNRGKRSLAVDLKQPDGLRAVRQLMTEADVIVENYRPGVLARFGLDYESIVAVNPNVIYTSVTGFGQFGPRATLPATDSILQAFSGLMSVNLDATGMPQRVGVLVIDVVTGLYAFQAISTALYQKLRRGVGRHISVSLMDSIGAVQAGKMVEFHLEGKEAEKPGVPVATYRTADGYMTINARRDKHFDAFVSLLGCPELAADARFKTAETRAQYEADLMPRLIEKVAKWASVELAAALTENDILHAPVNDYRDYLEDPHIKETEAVHWVSHPGTGPIPLHSIPGLGRGIIPGEGDAGLSAGPAADDGVALSPGLGEHGRAILAGLGFEDTEIAAMASSGAVVFPDETSSANAAD